jgi:NhaP-type Na+/H+ or K+/H+ antiporter
MAPSSRGIAVVVLPLLAILASDAVGASMFIAAFVAGMVAQRGFPEVSGHSVEFTEEWGQFLNDAVFFLFGMIVAGSWEALGLRAFVYAALSLTIVRMLPVALALAGTRLGAKPVLFMGWFGPRGLASIVLGLVYVKHQVEGTPVPAIHAAIAATVLVSIFAHGLSAKPGIRFLAHSSGTAVQESSGS